MQQLILIIHILAAAAIISLVLLQHGKGADAGAAFGSGASQTVFGSKGAIPFLVKLTALLAAIFFITSLALGYYTGQEAKNGNKLQVPLPTMPAPAKNSK